MHQPQQQKTKTNNSSNRKIWEEHPVWQDNELLERGNWHSDVYDSYKN